MILVGIGSNLAAPGYASPLETAQAALVALPKLGASLRARSSWYASEPVPRSDQPWFINAVVEIATEVSPAELLRRLLAVESRFARERNMRDEARTLDLDLLDYDGVECATPDLVLPHPRLHERRFVLVPLCEIAPQWRHPRLDLSPAELLTLLPSGQAIRRLSEPDESRADP